VNPKDLLPRRKNNAKSTMTQILHFTGRLGIDRRPGSRKPEKPPLQETRNDIECGLSWRCGRQARGRTAGGFFASLEHAPPRGRVARFRLALVIRGPLASSTCSDDGKNDGIRKMLIRLRAAVPGWVVSEDLVSYFIRTWAGRAYCPSCRYGSTDTTTRIEDYLVRAHSLRKMGFRRPFEEAFQLTVDSMRLRRTGADHLYGKRSSVTVVPTVHRKIVHPIRGGSKCQETDGSPSGLRIGVKAILNCPHQFLSALCPRKMLPGSSDAQGSESCRR